MIKIGEICLLKNDVIWLSNFDKKFLEVPLSGMDKAETSKVI